MSIKKLLPLIFLVVVAFVGFGFVKPLIDTILLKSEEKGRKTAEFDSIRDTRENFEKLSLERSALASGDDGAVLSEYLPVDLEQARVADMVNYVSVGSGVVLENISFDKSAKDRSPKVVAAVAKDEIMVAPRRPEPASFTVTVDFLGSYGNVRDFISEIAASGRYDVIRKFSVAKDAPRVDETGATVSSDLLSGEVTFEIFYLSERSYPHAHLLPVFSAGTFDVGPLERLLELEKRVPPMSVPDRTGRDNPFVS